MIMSATLVNKNLKFREEKNECVCVCVCVCVAFKDVIVGFNAIIFFLE